MQDDKERRWLEVITDPIMVITHLEGPLPDRHGGSKGGLQAEGVRDRDPKILAAAPPALHQPVPVYPSEGTHIGDACGSQGYVPCSTNETLYSSKRVKGRMEKMLAIPRVVLHTKAELGKLTWLKGIDGLHSWGRKVHTLVLT